jgi:Holliday junction resolvasome RuvABC endonuclease subunit
MKYIIGIDPGNSATAIAVLKPVNMLFEPVGTYKIEGCSFIDHPFNRTIMADTLRIIVDRFPDNVVYIENPILKGAANNYMMKLIGVIETRVNIHKRISPSTVKRVIGGHGASEKDVVAAGVMTKIVGPSKVTIKKLIENQRFDETDAIAIAMCGHLNSTELTNMDHKDDDSEQNPGMHGSNTQQ